MSISRELARARILSKNIGRFTRENHWENVTAPDPSEVYTTPGAWYEEIAVGVCDGNNVNFSTTYPIRSKDDIHAFPWIVAAHDDIGPETNVLSVSGNTFVLSNPAIVDADGLKVKYIIGVA